MTRVTFAVLGTLLLACWLAGMITNASHWMRWVDFVAGSFSWVVAMSPVFTGTIGRRDASGYAWAIAISLVIFFSVMLWRDATPWLTWTTLAFAFLYAGAGVILVPRRSV